MNKKKVIVVSDRLISGGVEVSLINFVDHMQDKLDLDVFLCRNGGALKDRMSKNVKIIEGNKLVKFLSPVDSEGKTNKSNKIKNKLKNIIKRLFKFFKIRELLTFFSVLFTKKIKTKYDCAFCFYSQKSLCNQITLKKIDADKKIAYIHADVSKYKIKKNILKSLLQFDLILCVSKSSAEVFKQVYPEFSGKVDYLYNFQDCNKIKELANTSSVNLEGDFNILSVSRLDDSCKAIVRSLEIFKQLKANGYKFTWHLIGDGVDRNKIENYILNNDMSDIVKLYGNKSNPFPYFKDADLFYLGSYQESWGMVLIESMTLGVPVLTTRTCSVEEILDGKGFICENDKISIYESMKFILENKSVLNDKRKELDNYVFDNKSISEKFLSLIS